ncbi:MAG: N-acetylmuramoyl-L-alanine amidase [Lachnospiraceae bacterium]|nr:N-acetylmuramoyl-L-alanine amidase [Lachnospiraceae bacterium]
MKKIIPLLAIFAAFFLFPLSVQASPEHPVVVIDPGHGGENLGGEYGDITEKYITQITANAMYEELTQYDNVTVYLTRTEDVDLSLKERCKIASSYDADLLVCLHYNLSENHTLFGAECWVSMFDPYYNAGYTAANEFIKEFKDRGMFIRGIKTRMNEKGTDYYGILRESVELELTTVLVEHGHLDEDRDASYCDDQEDWEEFGRRDATAVARYFHLASASLGVDYSTYETQSPDVTSGKMVPDESAPLISELSLEKVEMDAPVSVTGNDETVVVSGTATFILEGYDPESGILYYDYSLDGIHFSKLYPFREGGDPRDYKEGEVTFTVPVTKGKVAPRIVCRTYNGYDLDTQSNEVVLSDFEYTQQELDLLSGKVQKEETVSETETPAVTQEPGQAEMTKGDGMTTVILTNEGSDSGIQRESKILFALIGMLVLALLLFVTGIILLFRHVLKSNRNKRRRNRDDDFDV